MAEWLYEAGIGEDRAALVEDGRILEAIVEPHDAAPRLGTVVPARLIAIGRHPRVRLDDGSEAVLDRPAPGVTLGAALKVEIVREAIPERGRPKLPRATPTDAAPRTGPDLLRRIEGGDDPVTRCLPHQPDRLEAAGWSEAIEEATSGEIMFPGGALRMSVTPAMTLFDIDGDGAPFDLALAGATSAAASIRRFGLGGSIGLDCPTLANRAERQAVAEAIDAILPPPFERTAVNGFGFLQIVRPRPRASLPERLAQDPPAAAARALLRRLERVAPPGPAVERVSAQVFAALRAEWIAELGRRTGTLTRFETS